MVHVAKEMERRGLTTPLLIGGATTSRQHTAVKIAPGYQGTVVHVLDASRAVGVANVFASKDLERKAKADAENRADQQRLREVFAQEATGAARALARAREHATAARLRRRRPLPPFVGVREVARVPLDEIMPYIDWTFFFTAWELKGKFPQILDHAEQGKAARELFHDAERVLARIVEGKRLTANAAWGFFPARRDGDDLFVSDVRFPMLRQQQEKTASEAGRPYVAGRLRGRGPTTTSARSRSPRASAWRPSRGATTRRTTTITRSSPRPSPIAWPRPSPSACTNRYAAPGTRATSG